MFVASYLPCATWVSKHFMQQTHAQIHASKLFMGLLEHINLISRTAAWIVEASYNNRLYEACRHQACIFEGRFRVKEGMVNSEQAPRHVEGPFLVFFCQ